jgi:NAD(P)-dependent dehydrogenase (short-subunit alcohol dehydrogenase family)
LVSGASSGIGKALVDVLVDRGETVIATVRKDSDRQLLNGRRPSVVVVQVDLTDPSAAVEAVVRAAIAQIGGLDVLVNNAGYGLVGAVEESSEVEARHQLETNFWGPWKLIRAALPALRASDCARVLNISSMAGFTGVPAMALYNASKFALEGLSHALRLELADHAIGVTIVEPGAFRTAWAGGGLRTSATALPEYEGSTAAKMRRRVPSMDGRQAGDPVRAAQALVALAEAPDPPVRIPLGSDAVSALRGHLRATAAAVDVWEELAISTDFPTDDVLGAG